MAFSFKAAQHRIDRSLGKVECSAASFVQSLHQFVAVCCVLLETGEQERFEMAAQQLPSHAATIHSEAMCSKALHSEKVNRVAD